MAGPLIEAERPIISTSFHFNGQGPANHANSLANIYDVYIEIIIINNDSCRYFLNLWITDTCMPGLKLFKIYRCVHLHLQYILLAKKRKQGTTFML